MKLKNKRNNYVNNYILVSQVLFFLILGILMLRTANFSYENIIDKSGNVLLFIFVLAFLPFLNLLKTKSELSNVILDFAIIVFFIFLTNYLFMTEKDNLFKIVLLMPVLVTALRYGTMLSFAAAILTSISSFYVTIISDSASFDADIMLSGILFLLAWLLGNMTETEAKIRTELERLATHDSLTDILNHRSFQAILDEELIQAKKNNSKLNLMLLDLDYFKVYNDSLGHQKGDQVLIKVAEILKKMAGTLGYCARYGGEEFAIILPNVGIKPAKVLGEEIRSQVEQAVFPGMEVLPKGKLTISIGIAEFPSMADNKEKLIQKADEALYKAKFVSKNKVETYYSVFDDLSLSLKEEEKELFNSIRTLSMVINAKDRYTYGHSERVMELSKRFAEVYGLDDQLGKDLLYGSLLHDIGKIEISREVLNKPKKLNNTEWQQFKQHPQWGADIIRPLKSLKGTLDIVLYHHENFDGTGYPFGLKGEKIPLGARILRIIDSYDAITTNRPYKEAMSKEQAIEELLKFSGIHYDPVLLKGFCGMITHTKELLQTAK
ncbi:MAG: bifunctional diguanylate cyclase/phosphohydrolase [Bacillota bacterium]